MTDSVYQPSFVAGELAPSLYGRVDLARYKSGLALAYNFFISFQGGAISRPGTQFVDHCHDEDNRVRLVRFEFSSDSDQCFVLEFGHEYVRIIKDGAFVVDDSESIIIVTTPYQDGDLKDLVFAQSGDKLTITHVDYETRDLIRTNTDPYWALSAPLTFGPTLSPPGGLNVANTGDGEGTPPTNTKFSYIVTAVGNDGDESRGSARHLEDGCINITQFAASNEVFWNEVTDADYYNVYRAVPAINGQLPASSPHGFIGSVKGLSMVDANILPDFTRTPPRSYSPFQSPGNYPAVSSYFQQRKIFAGTENAPQTLWGTKPGNFKNLDTSIPVNAGDGYVLTLASTKINAIRHLVNAQDGLIIFTTGGIWQLGGGGQAVTAINANATLKIFKGVSRVPPIPLNYDILFVEERGGAVSTFLYSDTSKAYISQQVSVLASHLFQGVGAKKRTVKEWAFAEAPYNVLWAVTNDGVLLSFTFLREQEVFAWAQHSTAGSFESVCVVPENGQDIAYFVVRRFINGVQRRMIERFAPRDDWRLVEDAWCVDCGASTSLTYPAANVEFENLTTNTVGGTVVLKATAAVFASSDVGKIVRIGGGIGTVSQFITTSRVRITITTPIPLLDTTLIDVPVGERNWSMNAKFTTVSGLGFLTGETVVVVADGLRQTNKVVPAGGTITLDTPASRVTVGLPFTCKLQTLPLDPDVQPTVQGKRRRITAATAKVVNSRGLQLGPKFDQLHPIKEILLDQTPLPQLISGDERINLRPVVDTYGQVCIQQSEPFPSTILSITPEVDMGDES